MRCSVVVVSVLLLMGCGDEGDEELATKSSASTGVTVGEQPEPAVENGETFLPASAAGSPSESGPGVPFDFSGTVKPSIQLTAQELASIAKANAQSAARNPPGAKPQDLGFGPTGQVDDEDAQ